MDIRARPLSCRYGAERRLIDPFSNQVHAWDDRVQEGAETVRKEREERIREPRQHGGKRKGDGFQVDNVNLKGGNNRDYRIAQLKKAGRDDLVEKVIEGTLSANAAAIQAAVRFAR